MWIIWKKVGLFDHYLDVNGVFQPKKENAKQYSSKQMADIIAKKQGGIKRCIRPAVEPGPENRLLLQEDRDFSIEPIRHRERNEEPQENIAEALDCDPNEHNRAQQSDRAEQIRDRDDAIRSFAAGWDVLVLTPLFYAIQHDRK